MVRNAGAIATSITRMIFFIQFDFRLDIIMVGKFFPVFYCYRFLKIVPPTTKVTRNRTRKMKNRIFATSADAIAIPVKPKMAATIATIKNKRDHFSIAFF